jgi:hypothetical protein
MIASDFWRFGAVAVLAGADATGHLSFELLVVLATLVGLRDGLFYPAFGGMVPLVVDRSSISSANSLIGVSRWTSLLIGPALAAGLYTPRDRRRSSPSTLARSSSRLYCCHLPGPA